MKFPRQTRIILSMCILLIAAFLRLYKLDQISPYWEEVALGYDAYSLLKTGADHHGNAWPIVALESFGDWKPAAYAYFAIPFIWILDLSVVAVRLPSAVAGIAIVAGIAVLARWVGVRPWIAAGVAAIAPWLITFSRAAWEVNLATALILWGVIAFLLFLREHEGGTVSRLGRDALVTSVLLLSVSLYTYHSARLMVPVLSLGFLALVLRTVTTQSRYHSFKALLQYWKTHWRIFSGTALTLFVLLGPLLMNLSSPQVNQRFQETSIFSDISVIEQSNEHRELAGNSLFARIQYHRYVLFGREIAANFLSHLSPRFLFVAGDSNVRHSLPLMGQLYHIEALFLIVGLFVLTRKNPTRALFFGWWLCAAILPASLTHATPHALRILPGVPVLLILIALGIQYIATHATVWLTEKLPRVRQFALPFVVLCIAGGYAVQFGFFWRYYTQVYPIVTAQAWQFGYEQMIATVSELQHRYPDLPTVITREEGRPAMYYWFFQKIDPRRVQAADALSPQDQGEYLVFENVQFVSSVAQVQPGVILAAPAESMLAYLEQQGAQETYWVNDARNRPVWGVVVLKD